MPYADTDAETEHAAFGRRERNPRTRRHDQRRDRCARDIDQPRQSCGQEDAFEIIDSDDGASVEKVAHIEIDAVEPNHQPDEYAGRHRGDQNPPAQERISVRLGLDRPRHMRLTRSPFPYVALSLTRTARQSGWSS